ncbi:hypothetical protein GRI62_00530 [Erythrobacter arachoides]|uniref:Transmembrane protein n=1 Tax=Aurantiacibacter arachoides TaxID=1850444 RepID=A0A844ZUU2_9SPHN|nr:hypothetical protein [Aurantiacibacter arachoides]MXO92091.1 hypothetical protein [Aurantiacibacter arachoides]GGD59794.1 membrane protein [Aurantiacibacter arachoides]
MDETATPAPPGHDPAHDPSRDNGVTLQRPAIVAILYIVNIMLPPFAAVVGVVLAYVWRADARAQAWEHTHFTYLIRTFWIGLIAMMVIFIGFFASFVGMAELAEGRGGRPPTGMFALLFSWMGLWIVVTIWAVVRAVLSLVKAGERQPMPRPRTLLW